MLLKDISNVGKILKTLNRLESIKEFNATLPVKIEVLKEINPIRYLIKLGNREIETKSYLPLQVGKKYFAQIKENKNSIQISSLKEMPQILDELEKIDFKKEINNLTKEEVLNYLANSNSKEEFIFFTNILIAMQKKIYHLIINEKKKALMQYKYSKNRVKFYSIFNHLGEIEGEITLNSLIIYSPFESTLNLINLYKNELSLEVFLYKKEVKRLYTFSNSLLNLKA